MSKREGNFNKRGQVTIFIIIAIVVIALGVFAYMFFPDIQSAVSGGVENPNSFIQSCIEEDIEDSVNILSLQGGSLDPEHYFLYNNEKVEYLCYSEGYYQKCVVQRAMLGNHIESEIEDNIKTKEKECFDSLEKAYIQQGYTVNLRKAGDTRVELTPNRIVTTFDYALSLTKDSTENYERVRVILNNNLYELSSIANNIISLEAGYGDAEVTIYMDYYRDLKVEKKKQSEGTTIYILTDMEDGTKLQFASRSLAWPPGYGADQVF